MHITNKLSTFPAVARRLQARAAYLGVMSKIMKGIFFLALVVSTSATHAEDVPTYVGVWQSNELKTLESMNSVKGIPEKTRLFLRMDFFGRLVNVVQEDSFATYFINEKPERLEFSPYELEIVDENVVRTTYYDETLESEVSQILTFEGDCYFLLASKWDFKEYFCRVK